MYTMLIIPAIVFYLWLILVLSAFVICGIYCRIEKKRKINIVQSTEKDRNSVTQLKISRKRIIINRLKAYLYGLSRYMSIVIGKIPSHHLRRFLLKNILCMDITSETVVYGGFEIRSPWNIKIGRSVIGVGALLDGRRGIVIEDDVCLAQNVSIYTLQHDVNDFNFGTTDKGGAVIIKNHSWVSSKTTILPKCVVEEGVVLASGATLTKSTEAYGIYGGIPAKKIAERKSPMQYRIANSEYWHFY